MKEENDLIEPDKWTQEELVKHLYREFRSIKKGQKELIEAINSNNSEIDRRIRSLEEDKVKRDSVKSFTSTLWGIMGGAITLAVSLLIDWLKK